MLRPSLFVWQRVPWLLTLALVCTPLAVGRPIPEALAQPTPRIVNGIKSSRFPSTGALLNGVAPDTASMICSGVMIGCDTFLTAAHCVCESPGDGVDCQEDGIFAPVPSRYFVFLQHAGLFQVSRIAVHPDYRPLFFSDVAVLKLTGQVTGIAPTPLTNAGTPAHGTSGIIVGFGLTDGNLENYGIKRRGEVVLAACPNGADYATLICWNFAPPLGAPGTDSNTCNGDSGGPLFVRNNDFGTFVVAGVTSGGGNPRCLPEDTSYDTDLFLFRDWILSQSGADIHQTACGRLPQVGEAGTQIFTAAGTLPDTRQRARHRIEVPSQTALLRIAMNAIDNFSDFNLLVKAGSPPMSADFDCRRNGTGQFAFCQFRHPAPGPWHILVQRVVGSGPYQVISSTFDGTEIPVFCHGIEATIVGTEADDTLSGTPGADVIAGLGGNDVIAGLEGNDVICGGSGDDRITGGPGNNRLDGNEGNDLLQGGEGKDRLWGGEGHDRLAGGAADDTLFGGAGNDTLVCGPGVDIVNGGEDTDTAEPNCEAGVAIP